MQYMLPRDVREYYIIDDSAGGPVQCKTQLRVLRVRGCTCTETGLPVHVEARHPAPGGKGQQVQRKSPEPTIALLAALAERGPE